jgi:hypothetical protein
MVCVLSLLGACDSDDGTDLSKASCAELGAHLERMCGDGIWSLEAAELEEDCAIFGIGADERACLGHATRCDESLGECGLNSTTWGCHQGDDDCPPGLRCDLEEEECFACFADTDCDASRLCVDHHCIRDTPRNRAIGELIDLTEDEAPDAGQGTNPGAGDAGFSSAPGPYNALCRSNAECDPSLELLCVGSTGIASGSCSSQCATDQDCGKHGAKSRCVGAGVGMGNCFDECTDSVECPLTHVCTMTATEAFSMCRPAQ